MVQSNSDISDQPKHNPPPTSSPTLHSISPTQPSTSSPHFHPTHDMFYCRPGSTLPPIIIFPINLLRLLLLNLCTFHVETNPQISFTHFCLLSFLSAQLHHSTDMHCNFKTVHVDVFLFHSPESLYISLPTLACPFLSLFK